MSAGYDTPEGIHFDYSAFEDVHGTSPSGYGLWKFRVHGTDRVIRREGRFASARAAARKEVKRMYGVKRRGEPLWIDLVVIP